MANKHMRKKKTASLIKGGGIQIKTTTRYHLTFIRISNIKKKKKTESKCWPGWGESRTLGHCGRECKMVQPLQKIGGQSL